MDDKKVTLRWKRGEQAALMDEMADALREIARYEYPRIGGYHEYSTFTAETGGEHKHKMPVAAESAMEAIGNIQAIATAVLAKLGGQHG